MRKTILIVDDEERLALLLKTYLEQAGFRAVIAGNGRAGLALARQETPDLIVLDIMMPELDGLEFMQQHRRDSATPVILLTARVDDADKVLGLELGADDYVTKPFSPRELTARVRAVLRRSGQAAPEAELLRAADVVLDLSGHTAQVGGRSMDLTPSEFDMLAALMGGAARPHAGHLVRRLRAHRGRTREKPARQAGAGAGPPALCRDGLRRWLPFLL